MDKNTLLAVYKAISKEQEKYIEQHNMLQEREKLYGEDNTELLRDTLGYFKGLSEALSIIKLLDYADFVTKEFGPEYVFEVGDWVVTNKEVDCPAYSFKKGTRVQIIGISSRGYDLKDEYGNRLLEARWDSVSKE